MNYINKYTGEKVKSICEFIRVGQTWIRYKREKPILIETRRIKVFEKPLYVFKKTYLKT